MPDYTSASYLIVLCPLRFPGPWQAIRRLLSPEFLSLALLPFAANLRPYPVVSFSVSPHFGPAERSLGTGRARAGHVGRQISHLEKSS